MNNLSLLKRQYEIENKWSSLIKATPELAKKKIYAEQGYEELRKFYFDNKVRSLDEVSEAGAFDNRLILDLIGKNKTVLEIGYGFGNAIKFIAPYQKKMIGIERHSYASQEIKSRLKGSADIELKVGDFLDIAFDQNYFDAVYCDQVFEHIIPEEALAYMEKIHKILRNGGIFILITCNRATGPHDISKYFSETAEGMHLREYTYNELGDMLLESGFRRAYSIFDTPRKLSSRIGSRARSFLKGSLGSKCLLENIFIQFKSKKIRRLLFRFFRIDQIYLIAVK